MATPLTNIVFEEKGQCATWTIAPLPHPRIDTPLYQFVTELRIGIHISLMRDVMGPSFTPTRIAVTSPVAETRLTQELVSCPVLVEQPSTQIVLDTAWLDKAPTLGNRATHAAMLEICDGLLLELGRRSGVAGRVREVLLEDIANRPDFETVAKRLPEQGGLGCCGARGAKGRGQGECGSAKHGPGRRAGKPSQAQARKREAVTRNKQWPEKRFLVTIQGGSPVR